MFPKYLLSQSNNVKNYCRLNNLSLLSDRCLLEEINKSEGMMESMVILIVEIKAF